MQQLNPHQIQELRASLIGMVDTAIEDAATLIVQEIRQAMPRTDAEKLQLLAKLEALPYLRRVMVKALEEGREF
jgi:hypothetical protein